jgi:hypothetical protein
MDEIIAFFLSKGKLLQILHSVPKVIIMKQTGKIALNKNYINDNEKI